MKVKNQYTFKYHMKYLKKSAETMKDTFSGLSLARELHFYKTFGYYQFDHEFQLKELLSADEIHAPQLVECNKGLAFDMDAGGHLCNFMVVNFKHLREKYLRLEKIPVYYYDGELYHTIVEQLCHETVTDPVETKEMKPLFESGDIPIEGTEFLFGEHPKYKLTTVCAECQTELEMVMLEHDDCFVDEGGEDTPLKLHVRQCEECAKKVPEAKQEEIQNTQDTLTAENIERELIERLNKKTFNGRHLTEKGIETAKEIITDYFMMRRA